MSARLRFAFAALTLTAAASSACHGSPCSYAETAVPNAAGAASGPTDAQRAIAEADIVQLSGSRLYAMSASGTLSVIDVSTPGALAVLGTTKIPGKPFEMYVRESSIIAMTNGASDSAGKLTALGPDLGASAAAPADPKAGSAIVTIDATNPANMPMSAAHVVPGEVADSRIVGNVLYLATYENAGCYGCSTKARTVVTTFDVHDPLAVSQVDQKSFTSDAPDVYDLAWGMAWKRSIVATPTRLYLGGQAYVADPSAPPSGNQGIIDVLDISDPSGHLATGARLGVAGPILSRWQMDETDGVLRVISEPGAGFTGNGAAPPEVVTFRIDGTNALVPLGSTKLVLPMQEGLRTVHFDGPRAYAITFNQTDPLFAIDLSDPAKPTQRGQLQMPGWMFHLEPHGDRVIGLGVDRTDPAGSLNVSLFDVSNLDAPKLLKRVAFGAKDVGEDFEILSYEMPEDQDRIQKAFRVFDDGLVAIPFSSVGASSAGASPSACTDPSSGVQLVSWTGDTLVKRATLPVTGNPRRALENAGQMLAVSDSHVVSFSLANLDVATQTASVEVGTCVAKTLPQGTGGGFMGGGDYAGSGGGFCF